MERLDIIYRSTAAVGGAAASYLYGGWSALLGILLAFVIIDYVTGVLAAGLEGRLSSSTGLKGIAKKVSIFALVAVAHLVDTALGDSHIIRDATIFFYMANELVSIIENSGRIGLPVPESLKRAVSALQSRGDQR